MQQTTRAGNAATTNTPPPSKKLNISLIPSSNDVHVGDDLKIVAEVSNFSGHLAMSLWTLSAQPATPVRRSQRR